MERLTLKQRLAAKRAVEQGELGEEPPGKWYVLHTYSGYENKVKKTIESRIEALDLRDRVYEVVVPTQEEIEIRSGQRHTVQRKVFPGYVLVAHGNGRRHLVCAAQHAGRDRFRQCR